VLARFQDVIRNSSLRQLQVRVPLDEFLGAIILKTDGQPALFAFAFDSDDRADAIFGMAYARADERIF
jgi:hypothetical protein